jgi:hypothetical protein
MEAKVKRMWSWLVDQIPASQLDTYAWRFGLAAILLPILGGMCGWIVLDIRDRSARLRASSEAERSARIQSLGHRADNAEQQLLEAKKRLEEAEKRQRIRTLNWDTFFQALAGIPRVRVELQYVATDFEAYMFSGHIYELLGPSGASWEVSSPVAAPAMREPPQAITIVAKTISSYLPSDDQRAITHWCMRWALG